ncbi:MAG: TraR/DksA C4-type zinc finger protein [Candidatus Yonathbacteria bacterium]|nr:TraR/DksA C4-type zinc finger protein [Candidatus Yonathbacteria bacterium]
MTNINISKYKSMLLEEKTRIEDEMRGIAHKNPEIKGDWEPSVTDLNNPTADINDTADTVTAFENNAAIEVELEARLVEVNTSLEQIEDGSYGVCKICNAPIEEKRLEANPAAKTCIEHRES